MAFFMFILTSADAFCKKLFLFISHSNPFCIFFCIAILVCNTLFPALSETGTLYARNLVRTLLYMVAVLVYLKFLRPYVRMVPGTKKRVVIVCGNPCKPDLVIENGMLRKRGTGIDSVVFAARKYDGDIRYELEDGYLTACVLLNA